MSDIVVISGIQVKASSNVEVSNNLVMDMLYEGTFAGRDTLKVIHLTSYCMR